MLTNLDEQLMYYGMIIDYDEFQKFFDLLECDGSNNQQFYFTLMARRKNSGGQIKTDKCQIKRGVATKDRLSQKIRQLEIAYGNYEIDGQQIREDWLSLYVMPNVRDMAKASLSLMANMARDLRDGKQLRNPVSSARNAIQKTAASPKRWFDVDVDLTPNVSFKDGYDYWKRCLGDVPGICIQTRGGFHFLVDLQSGKLPKLWYNQITDISKKPRFASHSPASDDVPFTIQMNGDGLCPVPGCIQAGFVPRIIH